MFGATTGRPRRCGWLDLPALRRAIRINGLDSLALTKLDIACGRGPIQVCVGYRIGGQVVDELPDIVAHPEADVLAHPTGRRLYVANQRSGTLSRLPIDLRRIEKNFRQTTIREQRDGLNLRYFVDVYAKAPPIVLFTKEDNLLFGPVPYGGPTHSEMLQMITPQEHSAPAADIGALFRWLSGHKAK